MKKIFILGGGGYVGAELVPYLLKKSYHVTVFDLFIFGQNVIKKNKNLKLIKGDLRNIYLLNKHIVDFDCVIHLACISNDPSFELNPKIGKTINYDYFKPFIKICKNAGVKRFIYASSSSVYGIQNKKNVTENIKTKPLTDYSKFKLKCEKILIKENSKKFETVILRPATVCGYSRRQRLDLVLNILVNYAYNKGVIEIFGGSQLRPLIHIKDMVRAYYCLVKAKSERINGKIFNVGYKNYSVNNLANLVRDAFLNKILLKNKISTDKRSYHISSKKFIKEMNFKMKYNAEDAIRELILAFKKKLIVRSFSQKKYYNIQMMKKFF